jgi:hypothetical protein
MYINFSLLAFVVLVKTKISAAVNVFLTCLSTYFTTTCYVGTRESYLRHLKMLYVSLQNCSDVVNKDTSCRKRSISDIDHFPSYCCT